MKENSIKTWHLSEDAKIFRNLAQEAWDKFDEEGLAKYEEEARYYEGLAQKLNDLAWHYACLVNENILSD